MFKFKRYLKKYFLKIFCFLFICTYEMIGRLTKNLNDWQEIITDLFHQNLTYFKICVELKLKHSITVRPTTLKHYLKKWNLSKNILSDDSPEIRLEL